VVLGVQQASITESLLEQFRSWGVTCVATRTGEDLIRAIETAVQKHTPFVVCEDELLAGSKLDLRGELARFKGKAHCILLSSPAAAVTQDEELLGLFDNILLKPAKQSHLFDALITAVEGHNPKQTKSKGLTDRFRRESDTQQFRKVSTLRILLAEDHHINRKLCLLMLDELGARADTVENGVAVLSALEHAEYDLILMDCNMPEMDGYEATKTIRQREATRTGENARHIPIVALTANALIGERERCLAAGMDDYLAKPFTTSELRDVLLRAGGEMTALPTVVAPVSRLDQLAAELDRESVAAMLDDFIKDLPERLSEMEKFMEAGQVKELERSAHSMKGISAAFGLEDLTARYRVIEAAAEADDLATARRHFQHLPAAQAAAIAWLRNWLAHKP
jgi:CheY-like chemotaxis protein/HPt (histidine-containing phosphotransfer) domain-containing protein